VFVECRNGAGQFMASEEEEDLGYTVLVIE
jgi:hypothetical protein